MGGHGKSLRPQFGQCLWIKDAELNTEEPGQTEEAQEPIFRDMTPGYQ